jgi:hypothetical protein
LWIHVTRHFETFLQELKLPASDCADAEAKALRVAKSLFAEYYPDQEFNTSCYAIVGSYAKGTAAKPRTDVDMIFVLPYEDFVRIDALTGNKQSQLLQEVKNTLLGTYPFTDIRGDGPVVKVPFSTYEFEVCPVFLLQDNSFLNAHTKNGGSWGYTNPALEVQWIRNTDAVTLGKATDLVKMLKAWKRECNVEIKSICLEVAAVYFVERWSNRDKTVYYYDWMVRDFFAFLLNYTIGGWTKPPGIAEQILFGNNWQTKCRSAYDRAVKACDHERADQGILATAEWQKVFGSQFKSDLRFLLPPPPITANLLRL